MGPIGNDRNNGFKLLCSLFAPELQMYLSTSLKANVKLQFLTRYIRYEPVQSFLLLCSLKKDNLF